MAAELSERVARRTTLARRSIAIAPMAWMRSSRPVSRRGPLRDNAHGVVRMAVRRREGTIVRIRIGNHDSDTGFVGEWGQESSVLAAFPSHIAADFLSCTCVEDGIPHGENFNRSSSSQQHAGSTAPTKLAQTPSGHDDEPLAVLRVPAEHSYRVRANDRDRTERCPEPRTSW